MTALYAFHVIEVGDMDEAVAFWTIAVGCSLRFTTPEFSEVAAGPSIICLRPPGRSPAPAVGLGIDVEDLDAACTAVTSHGGTVHRAPRDLVPGLRLALAEDPDGNRFSLTEHAETTDTADLADGPYTAT